MICRTRHPKAERPLIDYDFVMLIEPTVLLGSLIGVYLNLIFPSFVIIFLLVIVLSLSAYKTMKKGIHWHRKELEEEKEVNIVELQKFIPQEESQGQIEMREDLSEGLAGEDTNVELLEVQILDMFCF